MVILVWVLSSLWRQLHRIRRRYALELEWYFILEYYEDAVLEGGEEASVRKYTEHLEGLFDVFEQLDRRLADVQEWSEGMIERMKGGVGGARQGCGRLLRGLR